MDTGFDGYLAVNKEATKKLRVTPKGTILIRTATGYSETSIVLQLLREHQELDVTDLDQIKEIHKWRARNEETATILASAK